MANIGVKSGAANVAPYADWANAATTLVAALTQEVAGDNVFVSPTHFETQATAMALTGDGTVSVPTKVWCAVDTAFPPTAVSTGAIVETTGGNAITITGSFHFRGITFRAASGAVTSNIALVPTAANTQIFELCTLELNGTSASLRMPMGPNASSLAGRVVFDKTNIKFSNAGQAFFLQNAVVDWKGGALQGAALTTLIQCGNGGRAGMFTIAGVDLSVGAANMNIATFSNGSALIRLAYCKMPAGWTGVPCATVMPPGSRIEIFNCDDGDTNHKVLVQTSAGLMSTSTAVYEPGWLGTQVPHSYLLTTNSTSNEFANPLESVDMFVADSVVGTPVTVSIEVVTDGVTLTNADAWIEVMLMDTSGNPLGGWHRSRRADPLVNGTAYPTNSSAWTTTGVASPVKQTMSVTVTPQEAGYIIARAVVARVSTAVWSAPTPKAA